MHDNYDYNYLKDVLVEEILMKIPELTKDELLAEGVNYLTKNYEIYGRSGKRANIRLDGGMIITSVGDYEIRISISDETNINVQGIREATLLYIITSNLSDSVMREVYSYLYMISDDVTIIDEDDKIRENCMKIVEKRGVIDGVLRAYREQLAKEVGEELKKELNGILKFKRV